MSNATPEPSAAATPPAAPTGGIAGGVPAAAANAVKQNVVSTRREQFLIAKTTDPLPQDVMPIDIAAVEQALKDDPNVDFKGALTPRGVVGTLGAAGSGDASGLSVLVAEMDSGRADALSQHPQLVVEPDRPLGYSAPNVATTPVQDPGVLVPYGEGFEVTVAVRDQGGLPVAGATVYVYGSLLPAQGISDADGRVHLTLVGESVTSIRGLYVKPKGEFWSRWVPQPVLDPANENVVSLFPLSATFPGFPEREVVGWGVTAMKIDQLPPHLRGQGVRVAVIDSGAATTHQDLQQRVKAGRDVVANNDTTWAEDTIAHGSHCAGVIAGSADGRGIRGIAPEAEVHVCKIFPGGRFSHLIDALDYCIQNQIDVANLSLGSSETSELVARRIALAKQAGVACIVAAGNSGGPVQYPARSGDVLAVAAMGKVDAFHPASYHSTQVPEDVPLASGGLFSAKFSCFGPEVGVCGPGVAVVSSVPPDGYAAWDGTSMAAPHVTGLAALVLAHHDDFKRDFAARNAARVERLFQILKETADPLDLGDPNRSGAGLPNALAALGLATSAATPSNGSRAATTEGFSSIQRLEAVMSQAGIRPIDAGPAPSPEPRAASPLEALEQAMRRAGLMPIADGGSSAHGEHRNPQAASAVSKP